MRLNTSYLGLKLKSPVIVSSSPITSSIDSIVKAAQSGAGAIVLKSMFEEQLLVDSGRLLEQDQMYFWYPESIHYLDSISKENGVEAYIALLKKAKQEIDIPVIASVNCITPNEWPQFAVAFEEAGADALELNIAISPANAMLAPEDIIQRHITIITEVKRHVSIPVSVKLSPYFANLSSIIKEIDATGLEGIVMFNRFVQPDIDIEHMRVVADNYLSMPEEITHSLRWIALLSKKVNCDLAVSTGVHTYEGVVKSVLAGAAATQVCSTLILNSISYIKTINDDILKWLDSKDYESLSDVKGLFARNNDYSAAFERIQYMKRTNEKRYNVQ